MTQNIRDPFNLLQAEPAQAGEAQGAIRLLESGTYTFRQQSSGRYLDAYQTAEKDYRLVTRATQNDDSQRWVIWRDGTVYAIQQKSSGRYLDAHSSSDRDFRLVTRAAQEGESQQIGRAHV